MNSNGLCWLVVFSFMMLSGLNRRFASAQWANDYDGVLDFECPDGETINRIQSVHDNGHEDRVWSFGCKPIAYNLTGISCQYSGYVNDFDEILEYDCPVDGIWTGAHSEHDNRYEDRRWSFRCCAVPGHCPTHCSFTPEVNQYDEPMDYTVDDGYYIHGITSHHDNGKEDRRWRFLVCQSIPCGNEEYELRVGF